MDVGLNQPVHWWPKPVETEEGNRATERVPCERPKEKPSGCKHVRGCGGRPPVARRAVASSDGGQLLSERERERDRGGRDRNEAER